MLPIVAMNRSLAMEWPVSELIKTKQMIVLVWEDVLHVQTSAVGVTMYLGCGVIKLPAVRRFLTHCGDTYTLFLQ